MANNTNNILTGVKKIYFTPYDGDAPSSSTGAKIELKSIIADTVAISQDDPETNSIECETSDSPIIEATKLGKYTIEMSSADINGEILTKCLGFSEGTTASGGVQSFFAPQSYSPIYALIEIEMTGAKFVLPKVLLSSKIDASSLKTDVAKGTISGSCYEATIKVGSATAGKVAPFAVVEAVSGAFPTITVTKA